MAEGLKNGYILDYPASHFNDRTEESLIEEGFGRQQLPYIKGELKKLNGGLKESKSVKPRAERLKKAEVKHEKQVEAATAPGEPHAALTASDPED